jgi:hypothetical protein
VAIRLSDFIGEGENAQYILLQAMDLLGERQSGIIQIENPLFDPSRPPTGQGGQTVGDSGSTVGVGDLPDNLQNIVNEATQPEPTPPPTLTPDGTGQVVDNIMTVNDIEFFTVTTENGSDFFLVIDRQRTSNNVYLLNTVTEADLVALAEARGETMISVPAGAVTAPPSGVVVPPPDSSPTLTMEEIMQAIQDAAEQNQREGETDPSPTQQGGNNSGIIILAVILIVLVGGGLAAWKLLLPKLQSATQSSQSDIEDEDYDNEYDDSDEDYTSDFDAVEVDEDEDDGYGHNTDESLDEDIENVEGGDDDRE